MSCPYCRQIPHDSRCPLASESKSRYLCGLCEEPILNGEGYVENYIGEFAHYECFSTYTSRDVLNWLRIDIREMEDGEY